MASTSAGEKGRKIRAEQIFQHLQDNGEFDNLQRLLFSRSYVKDDFEEVTNRIIWEIEGELHPSVPMRDRPKHVGELFNGFRHAVRDNPELAADIDSILTIGLRGLERDIEDAVERAFRDIAEGKVSQEHRSTALNHESLTQKLTVAENSQKDIESSNICRNPSGQQQHSQLSRDIGEKAVRYQATSPLGDSPSRRQNPTTGTSTFPMDIRIPKLEKATSLPINSMNVTSRVDIEASCGRTLKKRSSSIALGKSQRKHQKTDRSKSPRSKKSSEASRGNFPSKGFSGRGRKPLDEIFIGARIEIFWPLDDVYYPGIVTKYRMRDGHYKIRYDDGETEWLHLPQEKFQLIHEDD